MEKIYKSLLVAGSSILLTASAFAQLHGVYTINPAAAASATNYQTLASVVTDITVGTRADGGPVQGFGVSASVTINISSGTYNEYVFIPEIIGASQTNTIIFQSAIANSSSVTISSSNSQVVYVNGADNITFKNLTFTQTGYGKVIYFQNGSNFLTINSCVLNGTHSQTNDENIGIITSFDGLDSNVTIINNTINYGSNGVNFRSSPDYERNNIIQNNTFNNQVNVAVYLASMDGVVITGNNITTNNGSSLYGMFITDCINATTITKNQILGNENGLGIYLASNTNGSALKRGLVANNFISIKGSNYENFGIKSQTRSEEHTS